MLKLLKFSFFVTIVGFFVSIFAFIYYSFDLPDFSSLEEYQPAAITRLYSADGVLIEEYGKEHRIFVPITSVPKSLINAFIAAEDGHYYTHPGIDLLGIVRASFANIQNVLLHKRLEGASTITQQVVKNFLLSSERSIPRKIKEALLSYKITQEMTKDQILELYLNQIYLGKGAYGVAIAAATYFNKSIDDLNLAESAFLASLPKAPSSMDPTKHYDKALARRNYVLKRMYEDGYITKNLMLKTQAEPIKLLKREEADTVSGDYYAEEVRSRIIEMFGEEMFYTGGLTVVTSMNAKYQRQAEISLRRGIEEYDKSRGYRGKIGRIDLTDWHKALLNYPTPDSLLEYKLAVILQISDDMAEIGLIDGTISRIYLKDTKWASYNLLSLKKILNIGDVIVADKRLDKSLLKQIPKVNGSFVSINPQTGQVLALCGGYDFKANKFNRATQAIRQPGSTIKPFVYLAGLENGLKPNDIFSDEPITLSQGAGMPMWKPKNYKGDFLGNITMRSALAKSRNLVTIRIMQKVGIEKVADLIKRFGIADNPGSYFSIGLGAVDTTVEKMARAYAALSNGGIRVEPHYIEFIQNSNGKIIYSRNNGICDNCTNIDLIPQIDSPKSQRIVDPIRNYQILSMMESVTTHGTAKRVSSLGKIIASKTGTTNNSIDAWYVGCTPILTTVVYIGYDRPKSLGKNAVGGTVALPIYVDFMQNAYTAPSIPFIRPEGIKEVNIDPQTGAPSNTSNSITEYFDIHDVPKNYRSEQEMDV